MPAEVVSVGVEDIGSYPHRFRSNVITLGIEDIGSHSHKYDIQLRSIGIETDPPPSPYGTPDPLNASVNEGSAWSANNTVVVSDPQANTFSVTYGGAGKPAWVTDDFDDTGVTFYASGTTLTFGGTPPYTGAGSAGVYSWTYTLSDGVNNSTLSVNLTVNNTNQQETLTPNPASPYNLTVGVALSPAIDLDVADPDGDSVTLSRVGIPDLPPGLVFAPPLPYSASAPYTVQIIGTPTTPGAYSVTLRASDGVGLPDDKVLNFTVSAPASDIVNQGVIRLIGPRFASHVR